MATVREKRPRAWEVRVFTGSDACGRPTQLSRTVCGGKRDAQPLAAQLESSGGKAKPAGRSVSDELDGWVKQNIDTRWRTRMCTAGMADAGINNLHRALSAARSEAERWGWVSNNAAGLGEIPKGDDE